MRHCFPLLWIAAFALVASSGAVTADVWVSASDPLVKANNDCGFVSGIGGKALIRRSFQVGEGDGVPVHVADRLGSGDEILVPGGGRIEWACGGNTLIVLGPESHVRLGGLRMYPGPDGATVSRLDITLLAGELRAQVRRNVRQPEAVLVSGGGGEAALLRGDMVFMAGPPWRNAVISGEASARSRRGDVTGSLVRIGPGKSVGSSGELEMDAEAVEALKLRLPFSHEMITAAKPPLPSMSGNLEAP